MALPAVVLTLAPIEVVRADPAPRIPLLAPARSNFDWTGPYIGGHVQYGWGTANPNLSPPLVSTFKASPKSAFGGLQIGYNYLLSWPYLVGVEADLSFPSYLEPNDVVWSGVTTRGNITEQIDYIGTLRGRFGYTFDDWLVYGTGGLAYTGGRFIQRTAGADDDSKRTHMRTGWTVGAGVEAGFERNWSVRLEYLYNRFGVADVLFPSGERYTSAMDLHAVRLGLNRKLDGIVAGGDEPKAGESKRTPGPVVWEIHGQATYILQGYPSFGAPYTGANSLPPGAQAKSTWTATAFLGVRLWDGGEFYFNPELLQGFGLSDTLGMGGFPNGEAQKSNFPYPHFSASRAFIRQTVGLGGAQETVESDQNQLAGKRDISRVTFTVGKFPVKDIFDRNAYASDPRVDFMNWSIWSGGAFDFSADKIGLDYGAVVELNQERWAVRAGYFLVPSEPNGNNFDMALLNRGSYLAELEMRYALFSRPGEFRVLGFYNSANMGNYRDALAALTTTPDLVPTRRGRTTLGYVLNLEQLITDSVGAFARWSWNQGRNETMAFTDISASVSFGASIKGTAWGRPNDTIGIGRAINFLSNDARAYFSAGGLGVLIGDGALNYGSEQILETYYALNLMKGTTLTFDYQFAKNPAFNADRGPISIFTGRLHAEF